VIPLLLQSPSWFDLDPVAPKDLLGAFLICLLTLAIFSFLYRDNPFYKLAEAAYVGVSAAYWMVVGSGASLSPTSWGGWRRRSSTAPPCPGWRQVIRSGSTWCR